MAQQTPSDTERTTLTRQVVVERALALADAAGLETVTIRRLARELGVTPMALYWHFRSKDELLAGMVDWIYATIDTTVDEAAPWAKQLRTLLESILRTVAEHPAAAPLISGRATPSEDNLRVVETMLDILRRAGFRPSEATQVGRHAMRTVVDLVAGAGTTPREGEEESGELLDARKRSQLLLESLSPTRYPRVLEAAHPLSHCDDPDAYYAFGLDLLLAGVETMSARTR